MSNRTKSIILIIAGLQLVLIVGLLALPNVVNAIPGRYRVWLQENHTTLSGLTEGVIDQVAPVATALPAPVAAAGNSVDITSLIAAEPVGTVVAGSGSETNNDVVQPIATAELPATPEPIVEEVAPQPTAEPTLEPTAAPTPTPAPLPDQVILADMGVVKQSFNNCGPANLTQVLNWYGSDITQEDVADYLKPNPEDRNVSPWQIADYVNEFMPGYQAIARSGGDLEMIKRFLAAGFPVVIEKGYELPESGWWGHYLTVYGYDDNKQVLYSQDTYLGPFDASGRIDSYDELVGFWQQFNNTFYVVFRPEQEAEVAAILGEDMFDDFKMWQKVAGMAEQETRDRPEDAFSWFNLGTALTRMGGLTGEARYYEGGAQAFDRAREMGLPPRMLWYQFQPYLAYLKLDRYQDVIDLADATLDTQGGRNVEETFWYKGHALAYLGDVQGAIEAYRQALAVNENFYPAQISLDSLGAGN
jgi:hypothetical protein